MDAIIRFIDRNMVVVTGVYLIHLGIVVIVLARGDADVSHVGESLIVLGAGILRFERREIHR
jgi:hypothetical protein